MEQGMRFILHVHVFCFFIQKLNEIHRLRSASFVFEGRMNFLIRAICVLVFFTSITLEVNTY